MKALHKISFILLFIGGLNWGLVGLGMYFGGNWNVVNLVFTQWLGWSNVEALVYVLVGLSALVLVFTHKKDCKMCESQASAAAPKM